MIHGAGQCSLQWRRSPSADSYARQIRLFPYFSQEIGPRFWLDETQNQCHDMIRHDLCSTQPDDALLGDGLAWYLGFCGQKANDVPFRQVHRLWRPAGGRLCSLSTIAELCSSELLDGAILYRLE